MHKDGGYVTNRMDRHKNGIFGGLNSSSLKRLCKLIGRLSEELDWNLVIRRLLLKIASQWVR